MKVESSIKQEKTFKNILREICEEENIKFTYLSKDWIIVLEKDGICRTIAGYKFDLNSHGLGEVCDDKYALCKVLEHFGIPVVEHNIVYAPSNKESYAKDCNTVKYLQELFLKYHKSVVLKINNGTCGNGVVYITDIKKLEEYYLKLCNKSFSLSLCPFIDIENEYRLIILNKKIELIYKKELPVVYGDGKSPIKELLKNFNYEYFESYDGTNKDIILKENEEYVYNWKFNLSGGAKASFDIDNEIKTEIIKLATKIITKVDLKFGSIDIIRDKKGNYYCLEINSGVMMDNLIKENESGYEIAKNIYKKAIISMFKEK